MLGNGRVEVETFDGTKRLGHIRGKMRKKVWINQGDIVLVSLRDYQEGKCDLIYKYVAEEARALKQQGEIPENAKINESATLEGEGEFFGDEVDFDEEAGEQNGGAAGPSASAGAASDSEEEEADVESL